MAPVISGSVIEHSTTRQAWDAAHKLFPPGKAVSGAVLRTTDACAVIELFGHMTGIVAIDELDYPPPADVSACVQVGQTLRCVVLEVDTPGRLVRLGTSRAARKRAAASQKMWRGLVAHLRRGMVVSGPVLRHADGGAIVDLGSGITGFVSACELDEPPPATSDASVAIGEVLQCVVVRTEPARRRVLLVAQRAVGKRAALHRACRGYHS